MLTSRRRIPSQEQVRARYRTGIWAENYIKFRLNDDGNYRYLFSYLDTVADLAAARHPDRVLDLGCGSGPLLRRLRDRLPHSHLVGVDLSPRLLQEVPPTAAVNGDALALPFADDSFAVIVCVAVSELFTDTDFEKVLAEARRVIRPGGTLIVLYRNPTSLWEPYWWYYRYPHYQNAYTRMSLRSLSRRADLPIEHLQGTYLAAPPLIYRNHRAFYRDWMPKRLLAVIRRLDIGVLSRLFPYLCRHFIVVHRVPEGDGACVP